MNLLPDLALYQNFVYMIIFLIYEFFSIFLNQFLIVSYLRLLFSSDCSSSTDFSFQNQLLYSLCLMIWPRSDNFFNLTVLTNVLFLFNHIRTSSLVILSVHLIRSILRYGHISNACILVRFFFLDVHVSQL